MLERCHLEHFKHFIFSFGMPEMTTGYAKLGSVDFKWSQISMAVELHTEEAYLTKWIPPEWLSFDRYLNKLAYR